MYISCKERSAWLKFASLPRTYQFWILFSARTLATHTLLNTIFSAIVSLVHALIIFDYLHLDKAKVKILAEYHFQTLRPVWSLCVFNKCTVKCSNHTIPLFLAVILLNINSNLSFMPLIQMRIFLDNSLNALEIKLFFHKASIQH